MWCRVVLCFDFDVLCILLLCVFFSSCFLSFVDASCLRLLLLCVCLRFVVWTLIGSKLLYNVRRGFRLAAADATRFPQDAFLTLAG